MEFLSGQASSLAAGLLRDLARYRHRVFVEELGWALDCQDGIELDQFDGSATRYVIARDASQRIVGTARLLPTLGPYLLGEVFPQLMPAGQVPRNSEIWELSRFAATDMHQQQGVGGQFSSPIAVKLLEQALRVAACHGVKRLITVSPLGVERLLRREGFHAHRAGPPQIVGGHPLFACWIEVEDRFEPMADSA
jgi:acyl homoserine lactone synthase